MPPADNSLIANIAGAAIIAVAAAMLFMTLSRASLRVRRALRYRSVFAPSILRPPGYRLRRRLDRQRDRLRAASGALLLLPLVFLAVLLAWPGELEADLSSLRWAAMLTAATTIALYLCVTLVRAALRLRRTHGDLAARIAISHGLERVMRRDFAVFHDVDFGDVIVDEIVVGREGVFALSVFSHPASHSNLESGQSAQFADGVATFPDEVTLELATPTRRHANAVARHFRQALREEIPVTAVAVLPGWQISCEAPPPFPIVNERNIDMITKWAGPERYLLDEQVEAIQEYLAQRCRDSRYRG